MAPLISLILLIYALAETICLKAASSSIEKNFAFESLEYWQSQCLKNIDGRFARTITNFARWSVSDDRAALPWLSRLWQKDDFIGRVLA